MSDTTIATARVFSPTRRRFLRLVERHVVVARRYWWMQAATLLEPFVYLAAVGLGIAGLVGTIELGGQELEYKTFVAPGLLVGAAMNEAVLESSIAFFIRFKYQRVYNAVLATPLSLGDIARADIAWSVARTVIGGLAFLVAMVVFGLVSSWWGLLCLPLVALVALAFTAVGLAGATALFLFSGVFFPVDQYPLAIRLIVEWTPLYQAVELARGLAFGQPKLSMLLNVTYLLAMSVVGLKVATRRLERLLRT